MVVAEACGDRSEEIHRANLTDLDLKSADVVDIDEVLTRLRQSG
jgi:maleamate amidohydrolase